MATINGTNATDIIGGTGAGDLINGLLGDDELYGHDGNDTLDGGANSDYIEGGNGNDIILGGAGEDYLVGGHGNDTIDGGTTAGIFAFDFDTVMYRSSPNGVNVNLATGVAQDGFGTFDTLLNVLRVFGSNHADRLTGGNASNDGFEGFRGYAGADTINGGTGFDRVEYNSDYGLGGRNGVVANFNANTVRDGFGDIDRITGIEAIRSTQVSDDLRGNKFSNRFEPLSGNDTINGGGGKDEVAYHNDHFFTGNSGGTTGIQADLVLGAIIDTSGYYVDLVTSVENVRGSIHDDDIRGEATGNVLRGNTGDDYLSGRAGADKLFGQFGQDTINGGNGNDLIQGGQGDDILRGGAARDRFIFEVNGDHDIVRDFEDGFDKIDVIDFGFANAAAAIAAASQVGNHVVFSFGTGDTARIDNFNIADLDATDLFV